MSNAGEDPGSSAEGSRRATSDKVACRATLAIRTSESRGWWDAVALTRVSHSWYIVADSQYELYQLDLASPRIEWILESPNHPRPILSLRNSGEKIEDYFAEVTVDGLPTSSTLSLLKADALDCNFERSPSLRGGGDLVRLPTLGRRRMRIKTRAEPPSPTLDHGAQVLRGQLGGADGLHPDRLTWGEAAAAVPNGVWVVATHGAGTRVGTVHSLSRAATVMENRALDRAPNGTIMMLEKISEDYVEKYERNVMEEWMDYAGRMTPRSHERAGAAAGGALLAAQLGGPPPAAEARVLSVSRNAGGVRTRLHRDYADSCTTAEFDDWPLVGPRTVVWVLGFCLAQCSGGLVARTQMFMSLCKLSFADGGMMEYNLIARCLDMALQWDQLSIGNLACMELLARRFQLIEEKYRHRMPSVEPRNVIDPDADSGLFLGLGPGSSFGRQSICVMPELSTFIGEELLREARITKGRVKAHELREQAKKLSKGCNHNGKNKDDEK